MALAPFRCSLWCCFHLSTFRSPHFRPSECFNLLRPGAFGVFLEVFISPITLLVRTARVSYFIAKLPRTTNMNNWLHNRVIQSKHGSPHHRIQLSYPRSIAIPNHTIIPTDHVSINRPRMNPPLPFPSLSPPFYLPPTNVHPTSWSVKWNEWHFHISVSGCLQQLRLHSCEGFDTKGQPTATTSKSSTMARPYHGISWMCVHGSVHWGRHLS